MMPVSFEEAIGGLYGTDLCVDGGQIDRAVISELPPPPVVENQWWDVTVSCEHGWWQARSDNVTDLGVAIERAVQLGRLAHLRKPDDGRDTPPPEGGRLLWTIPEVAARFGVTERSVARWMNVGIVKAVTPKPGGKTVRIPWVEVYRLDVERAGRKRRRRERR